MGLLSIFKRKNEASAVSEPADEVHRARTRARQRLIGAVILLAIGIVGFPLVFETQPRPIPVDIPIEIPRKDGAPPLVIPSARAPSPLGSAPPLASATEPTRAPAAALPDEMITESREEAGRDVPAPRAVEAPASRPGARPTVPSPAGAATPKPTAEKRPAAEPKVAANGASSNQVSSTGDDGARARALLDGKPPARAEAGRFVVQVGAFADASSAHDARLKIEKLGLKTYTQVANTAAGNRIRVRLGPFATRDEADKAMAKARAAGLGAVVLTL